MISCYLLLKNNMRLMHDIKIALLTKNIGLMLTFSSMYISNLQLDWLLATAYNIYCSYLLLNWLLFTAVCMEAIGEARVEWMSSSDIQASDEEVFNYTTVLPIKGNPPKPLSFATPTLSPASSNITPQHCPLNPQPSALPSQPQPFNPNLSTSTSQPKPQPHYCVTVCHYTSIH